MVASLLECRLWSTWLRPPDGGRLICCLLCISQSKSIWNHSQIGSDRWWSSQADLSACSQKSGCPMNSRLRRSNSIGHHLILWLASPESALLRSRRSFLPCDWFLFWFSLVRCKKQHISTMRAFYNPSILKFHYKPILYFLFAFHSNYHSIPYTYEKTYNPILLSSSKIGSNETEVSTSTI